MIPLDTAERFFSVGSSSKTAIIEWPDAARFLAWRFQPIYDEAMLTLRAKAERGSVYFLPRGVYKASSGA